MYLGLQSQDCHKIRDFMTRTNWIKIKDDLLLSIPLSLIKLRFYNTLADGLSVL